MAAQSQQTIRDRQQHYTKNVDLAAQETLPFPKSSFRCHRNLIYAYICPPFQYFSPLMATFRDVRALAVPLIHTLPRPQLHPGR